MRHNGEQNKYHRSVKLDGKVNKHAASYNYRLGRVNRDKEIMGIMDTIIESILHVYTTTL